MSNLSAPQLSIQLVKKSKLKSYIFNRKLASIILSYLVVFCLVVDAFARLTYGRAPTSSELFDSGTFSQLGNQGMVYGRDGVCSAFAHRAQQGFEDLGIQSRIVWADTSAGYHAFNEVLVDTNGDRVGDTWQIYEPQSPTGQPWYDVHNVQNSWDKAADAPLPGQGAGYSGNGGGQKDQNMNQLDELLAFIMMFQTIMNMKKQAGEKSNLQREQRDRYGGAAGNLAGVF